MGEEYTLEKIKEDLLHIRYYYSRKEQLDKSDHDRKSPIFELVKKYYEAASSASPDVLDVYYSLYHEDHTHESMGAELGYTRDYVTKKNKKLLEHLLKKLNEGGE